MLEHKSLALRLAQKARQEEERQTLNDYTDDELARAIIHARNKRDAFAQGREPQEVMHNLRMLEQEATDRRELRRTMRELGI